MTLAANRVQLGLGAPEIFPSAVDPSAGAGVVAVTSSILLRTGTPQLWQKTGAGATAWTLIGGGAAIGGAVSGGTDGAVLFISPAGVLAQNVNAFFWDAATNRLGIGNKIPGVILDVGDASTTNAMAMHAGSTAGVSAASTGRLRYNEGTQRFQVSMNGAAYVNLATGSGGVAIGDTVTGATAGSVFFAGAAGILAQDNANLFWDDTNDRLGIGTATPSVTLDVRCAAANANALRVEASQATSYAGVLLYGTSSTLRGGIGYANASVGSAHLQGKNFLYSTGTAASVDWVIGNDTGNKFTFVNSDSLVALELASGSSAAVSSASSGRFRYNSSTQKMQLSNNAGAYADLTTAGTPAGSISSSTTYTGSGTTSSILFVSLFGFIETSQNELAWDNTNSRMGLGTSGPAFKLDISGSYTTELVRIYNVNAAGLSGIHLKNSGGVQKGSMGHANGSYAVAAMAGTNYLFSPAAGPDWTYVFDTARVATMLMSVGNFNIGPSSSDPAVKLRIEAATASAGIELGNGETLAVGPANTMRMRYNQTTAKAQLSLNGAAYVDIVTI